MYLVTSSRFVSYRFVLMFPKGVCSASSVLGVFCELGVRGLLRARCYLISFLFCILTCALANLLQS